MSDNTEVIETQGTEETDGFTTSGDLSGDSWMVFHEVDGVREDWVSGGGTYLGYHLREHVRSSQSELELTEDDPEGFIPESKHQAKWSRQADNLDTATRLTVSLVGPTDLINQEFPSICEVVEEILSEAWTSDERTDGAINCEAESVPEIRGEDLDELTEFINPTYSRHSSVYALDHVAGNHVIRLQNSREEIQYTGNNDLEIAKIKDYGRTGEFDKPSLSDTWEIKDKISSDEYEVSLLFLEDSAFEGAER